MKLFVTGGTGFVGDHVIRELLKRGHEVRLLVHRRSPARKDVELYEGDVTNLDSFEIAAKGCDAVINLVGIIREFPARNITFKRLHVEATANVLAAARKADIKRYIQMSALGTCPEAVSRYHRSKFQAEDLVRSSGLEWTIMRPSLIYGPRDSFINMLAGQVRLVPVMPVIGSGTYRLQPIHADDVARCFAMALEMPETVGQCYELCGSERLTYESLLDAIASAMGRQGPLKPHLPMGVMKPLIAVMQHLPQFPITSDQLQMLIEENICDCRWQETFHFEPRGLQDGIREYLGKVG